MQFAQYALESVWNLPIPPLPHFGSEPSACGLDLIVQLNAAVLPRLHAHHGMKYYEWIEPIE